MTVHVSAAARVVEDDKPVFEPLKKAAERLHQHHPTHKRIACAECGRQVDLHRAVRNDEGLVCHGCADDAPAEND